MCDRPVRAVPARCTGGDHDDDLRRWTQQQLLRAAEGDGRDGGPEGDRPSSHGPDLLPGDFLGD